jgi:hypothetical protein
MVTVKQRSENHRFGLDVMVGGNLSGVLGEAEHQKSTCLHVINFEASSPANVVTIFESFRGYRDQTCTR